ncbi:hypothetical protein LO772_31480 [Yinghuangia sp. ASG 101]|uniref:Eco57I restriction-modification methylase domain-containing protein n=1 Tax=Yinghuangia sp. ASG 101 TaxID=2896848 RepID=UPI001E5A72ED|nr:DNA methyltransferase [Yinghuangia sp. ASG 101]UGQ11275.1 hypothetical protein LO772_31480 [Yinghuangia sp. ASG 101]
MSPRPGSGSRAARGNPGLAAAIAKANDPRQHHLDWLGLVQVTGPFLTLPVLLDHFSPLDSVSADERKRLRAAHTAWQAEAAAQANATASATPKTTEPAEESNARGAWIEYILRELLEWGDALALREGATTRARNAERAEDAVLDRFTVEVPEHQAVLHADFALVEPGAELTAESDVAAAAKRVRVLGMIVPEGTTPTGRAKADAGSGNWPASPADRLAKLLRGHGVDLGVVTDGRWWCLVWAPLGGVTTTVVFDSIGWNEQADRYAVRAWVSLLRRSRFFAVEPERMLVPLLKKSLDNQEEVTDALGVQVRRAVELLVDAIGRADAATVRRGGVGLKAQGVYAEEVYRGAVAVMMRVVFLLFAEERGLLPADNELYAQAYSAGRLCAELEARADAEGESALDYSHAAWHRLIALFHAVYGGVDHPDLHLPAYDGSIFDPTRYWWMEGMPKPGTEADPADPADPVPPLLPIDDRTVLHMLASVQYVTIGGDKKAKSARQLTIEANKRSKKQGERRKLSFRALDVEQIGYVYEGLLSYDGRRAIDTMVGLIGPLGKENEVSLDELEGLAAPFGIGKAADPGVTEDVKGFAKAVVERFKEPKPGIGTVGAIEKALAPMDEVERADAQRQFYAACRDLTVAGRLVPFFGLIRADLRGYPTVMNAGALYVGESPLRKNTGTHYTPRFLAEEVVEGALEPLVFEPGPLQTADRDAWAPLSAAEILNLKIADIAMGSAAFLVAACRYLADRLIEAWAREGDEEANRLRARQTGIDTDLGADAEADPLVVRARRLVIEHCLYGVDINPLAVEMAKLSLWLVSMDKDRPFTFLDDRLIAGDSLLGVASMEQLETVHMDPEEGRRLHRDTWTAWTKGARERVASVAIERREIAAIQGDDLDALDEKRRLLDAAHEHVSRLDLIGDLTAGAGLAGAVAGEPERRKMFLSAAEMASKIADERVSETDRIVQEARQRAIEWLETDAPEDGLARKPVHWPLEFPEVFEQGGFDAVIGNPPFLGGQKLTGAMGVAYREYLVLGLGRGRRGSADLVAYFALRAHQLLNERGQTGLIATNTLAQGDTREVGLDQLVNDGVEIRQAIKSARWPSKSAVLEYCAVWTSRAHMNEYAPRCIGGVSVIGISSSLHPKSRVASWVERLTENSGICFQGAIILGLGFTLPEAEARAWIAEDRKYSDVLFPYLTGQDINSSTTHTSDRWVINFGDRCEQSAMQYPRAYARVLHLVKPERELLKREARKRYWWRFAEAASGLYRALGGLGRHIVISRVSKVAMPVMIRTGPVLSEQVVAFASDDHALLAFLSSAPHYWWAMGRSSTMKGDMRYAPSDVFDTLVRPEMTVKLRELGVRLDEFRSGVMADRKVGLTRIYNLVHDASCVDGDIEELRALHCEIDVRVVQDYGWDDLAGKLMHGFQATAQGERYTIGTVPLLEITDRLRELNHQRYADEVALGLHKKPKRYADMPPPSADLDRRRHAPQTSSFVDDGLFPPEDALF